MQHLLDFFDRYVHGSWTALLYDDGLRPWSYTADQLRATSEAFARRIGDADLRPGDRLVIWSDNCPEWLAAFWGAMLRGVAVIPLDAGASPELVRRIIAVAAPRAIVTGNGVDTALWILPLANLFMRRRVDGQVHLSRLRGPVIFAANHQSHFDTPAILSSLPIRWRRHLAVTMAKEFFEPHFAASGYGALERVTSGALYGLAVLFFFAIPLPRTGPGTRDTLRYAGELAAAGVSFLIFPEGHRTEHGEIGPFQPGVAMMASKLRLPVVPVRLEGLERVLHHTWRWPRRGPVRIRFGPALELEGDDYPALARRVEQAVKALSPEVVSSARTDAA